MVRFQIIQKLAHFQDLDMWVIYKITNGSAGMVEFPYCRAEDIAATYFIATGENGQDGNQLFYFREF